MTAKQKAEKFVDDLLSTEAFNQPTDTVHPDKLVMELPKWFDEEKFNRGRKFYSDFKVGFSASMLIGLVALFAVPSIVKVLTSTRRSNSSFTAYKRYVSTILHVTSWFEHELKPGSLSWRSLTSVRTQHIYATKASKIKEIGVVSQRDVALTQFGLFGLPIIKPDANSILQMQEGDWDAYNHVSRVIGYMLGLEDRYNVCRETVEETLEVGQLLISRVFTPCLENPPEYFEHGARAMLDGIWFINPTIDVDSMMWWTKYLCEVPGYIYCEADRRKLQAQIREKLEGKSLNSGVDVTTLMQKPAVEGLPDLPPRLLYYNDYNSIKSSPEYEELSEYSRYKLFISNLSRFFYGSSFGRWLLNIQVKIGFFFVMYFPYLAFFRFGVKPSFVNMFKEGPKDDTRLKLNAEFKLIKKLSNR